MHLVARQLVPLLSAVAITGFAPTTARSASANHANPTIEEIATGYRDFLQVTKEEYIVDLKMALYCRGATQEEVEASRVRFGPHVNAAILIFVNARAATAIKMRAPVFPVGAVVVKHKAVLGYTDKGGKRVKGDNGVGGMVKRAPGFDPEHGDWEYFYFENPKKIESGRIASCVQCHAAAKDRDHVFGDWYKPGN